jgi:hypothetical protein
MKPDIERVAEADLSALEPEQRSDQASVPLPRRRLGPWALAALWILRLYALAAVGIVVYFFVRTLAQP